MLECTIEEVSVAHTKKKVCWYLDCSGRRGVLDWELLNIFHNLVCFLGAKATKWNYLRGESVGQENSGTTKEA